MLNGTVTFGTDYEHGYVLNFMTSDILGRRTGFCSAADVFFSLDIQISEVPRPIAAKLCHMIAIWRQSPAKDGQLGGPPLKNLGAKNMQNFGRL